MAATIIPEPELPPPEPAPRRRGGGALVFSAWGIATLATVALLGFGLYVMPTDARRARRAAHRLLPSVLDAGEQVQREASVYQRNWWDYFRDSYGVLAATDRRLIFIGIPPENRLLPPDGAPRVEVREFAFDTLQPARPARVFLGTTRGILLGRGRATEAFAAERRDRPALDSVLGVLERRLRDQREQAGRERAAAEAAAEAARQPVYHVVARGEALDLLARRYNTTVDSIRLLNGLPSNKVKVGQRLMVRLHAGSPPSSSPSSPSSPSP